VKRRDLLKGLAAAAVVGPALVAGAAEASPADALVRDPRADVEEADLRLLIEELRSSPAVRAAIERRILATIGVIHPSTRIEVITPLRFSLGADGEWA
jgi:uncharacterized protein YlxW (UPF0749 family)